MAAGYQINQSVVNNRVGSTAAAVIGALSDARKVQGWLLATPDATLTAMGFSAQDVADMKSAFIDLVKLADIFDGVQTQASTYNFGSFSKRLVGVNQY